VRVKPEAYQRSDLEINADQNEDSADETGCAALDNVGVAGS